MKSSTPLQAKEALHDNFFTQGGVVFHGKCGGALDGDHFKGDAVFFAPTAEMAGIYAEHSFMNGEVEYGYEYDDDDEERDRKFLAAAPVIYPVVLSMANPATLDTAFLEQIAGELGIPEKKRKRFIEDFEDSGAKERDDVFSWLRHQGFDGAILTNDLMPLVAGGDWGLQTTYVSFEPQTQVKFLFCTAEVAPIRSKRCRPGA